MTSHPRCTVPDCLAGTITAREIAHATGLPLHTDERGHEYIDTRDVPPEGVEYRGLRIGGSAGVSATFHLRSHGDVSREELERIAGVSVVSMSPCRAEQRGPDEWVCDCPEPRATCKPALGVPERLKGDDHV